MYSAYLIDDEELVLANMIENIPWSEHNIRIIGSSTSPVVALEQIPQLAPDVVFTDIKMPEMDGLALIEMLRKKNIESEFIIISVYEKFEYARQFIKLNGFDYLTKPFDEYQYIDLFSRLLERLNKTRPQNDLPGTSSNELNQIVQYLNRNISQPHSLKEIADQFSISSGYICNLFSKHMQTTFSTYVTKIKMENAARLLTDKQKAIKEIAVDCGYEDYFYFCRVFRSFYHSTPTKYRESLNA